MKSIIKSFALIAGLLLPLAFANAHCQIPCGIYADDVVFGELMTDVETIQKSMKQIQRLGEDPSANPNQLVRWVTNKEDHAQNIQETMSAYFLAQRISLGLRDNDAEKYDKLVGLAHEIIVLAMKCKQTTDLDNADKLEKALHTFQHAYSGK